MLGSRAELERKKTFPDFSHVHRCHNGQSSKCSANCFHLIFHIPASTTVRAHRWATPVNWTGTVKGSTRNQQPAFSMFISENASCPESHNSELSCTETGFRTGKTKYDTANLMLFIITLPFLHWRWKFQIFFLIQSVFKNAFHRKYYF